LNDGPPGEREVIVAKDDYVVGEDAPRRGRQLRVEKDASGVGTEL
jgi:hypothetical protein